ncbi:MAG: polymer-forming cytoskeletal protein [Caldilineaceae bacterium]|nr:polymer-forming cytoskeletal protein [Caldilineaceae bacterium]
MFRRNERPQPDAIEVIIGPRATYSGALRSDSSIRIDGVVESGLLETLANVILTEGARVNCEIRARNVSIRGYFDGVIRADRVELLAGCYVRGALHVNSFLLDEGATLEGELHMRGENAEGSLDLPADMKTPVVLPDAQSPQEPEFN